MTVQPTPNSHNRHRAFVIGHRSPGAAATVKVHKPENHTSWLQIGLFLEQMPKRPQERRS